MLGQAIVYYQDHIRHKRMKVKEKLKNLKIQFYTAREPVI